MRQLVSAKNHSIQYEL